MFVFVFFFSKIYFCCRNQSNKKLFSRVHVSFRFVSFRFISLILFSYVPVFCYVWFVGITDIRKSQKQILINQIIKF